MAYLAIEDFKGGLDKRRMELTSEIGSLQTLKNAHISRGGEIEKALAFVSKYTLPSGTFGFAIVRGVLYVFGSGVDPGVPVGVTYQRLQNPDGATMTGVVNIDVAAGKLYVVADFDDGTRHHFYDGTIVDDWYEGVVRSSMTNTDGIAEHLKALIDASSDYSASRSGSVITITGASSAAFDISSTAENGEGNTFNDQTAAVATTQAAVDGVVEVLATGSFRVTGGSDTPGTNRITSVKVDGVEILGGPDEVLSEGSFEITGGTNNPGTNTVDQVLVNGVDVLGAAVDHTGNDGTTATAVAAQITSNTSSPNYTATAASGVVTITAVAGTGEAPNGYSVSVSKSGDVTTGSETAFSGGSYSGVQWTTSNTATAEDVKDQIEAYTSSPEYDATFSGDTVALTAKAGTGSAPNGRVITVTVEGDVVISDITNMNGGVDAGSGQSQISTVTIGGTFEAGDLFSVLLDDETFGAGRVAGLQAEAALKVHKDKVYVGHESTLLFSGVAVPTGWKAENTGSGAIDMSSQTSGFEDITAISVYQNNLAIFARETIQIWAVDPDPDANVQLQVLENIGTRSPRGVVGFGDSDVFFPSDTGIRSLKARDSSNAAAISDVGTPIDTLVVAHMDTLTDAQIEAAVGVIEPKDGRYILALDDIMYVFSFFSSSKVSSWSTYERSLTIDWFARTGNQIYARSDNTIYLLGGDDGETYDNEDCVVELPYINAGKIADWKEWTGIDMIVEGTWLVEYNTDPNQPTVFETIGTVTQHTIGELNNAVQAFGPVFKLRFTNTTTSAAKLGSIIVHYRETGVR